MAIKRRRSRRSFRLGLIFPWLGAFAALGILSVAGIGLARLRADRAGWDATTLCASKAPDTVIALLFDSSDSLSDLQQIKISQIMDGMLRTVPKGARVDVYMATAEAGQLIRPLFSRCNPAGGDDASDTMGWNENPQRIMEIRRTQFDQPLAQALQKALRSNSRKTSPILETIAAASVQSFGRATSFQERYTGRNQLVVVSDFLQNSEVLTQYKPYLNIDEFSNTKGWIKTIPRLNKVSVKMVYINRANSIHIQNNAHKEWWCAYFAKRNAKNCSIEHL